MPVDSSVLHSRHVGAVRLSVGVVGHATIADLGRDTPCAGWTLADLLAHMIAQHRGFAVAATGERTEVDAWRPRPLAPDPITEYAQAADGVIHAYADADVDDRDVWLPELSVERPFKGRDVMTFHFIDYIVHSWDVARALDMRLQIGDNLVEHALAIAERIPNDPARRGPGFAFGPAVPTDPDASRLDRALAALGRSPSWPR